MVSAYENQRLENIARNDAVLQALGLKEPNQLGIAKPKPQKKRKASAEPALLVAERTSERPKKNRVFQNFAGLDGVDSGSAMVSYSRKSKRATSDSESDDDDDDLSDLDSDAEEVPAFRKSKKKLKTGNAGAVPSRAGRERRPPQRRMDALMAASFQQRVPRRRVGAPPMAPGGPPLSMASELLASDATMSLAHARQLAFASQHVAGLQGGGVAESQLQSLTPAGVEDDDAVGAAAQLLTGIGHQFGAVSPFAVSEQNTQQLPMPFMNTAADDDNKVQCPLCCGRFVPKAGNIMRKHQDPEYGGVCRASGVPLEHLFQG